MKYLMSAAEIQLRMEATGSELIEIPREICEKVAAQYQSPELRPRRRRLAGLYLRVLNNIDPSYRN